MVLSCRISVAEDLNVGITTKYVVTWFNYGSQGGIMSLASSYFSSNDNV